MRDYTELITEDSFNFTWHSVNITNDKLYLQLKFKFPYEVSEAHYNDVLEIEFKDPNLFRSRDSKYLDTDSLKIQGQIPMLIEKTAFTQSFKGNMETGSDCLKGLFTLQFLLSLILSGILGYMALWVNALQIITMMPLFMIGFPGITLIFLSAIVNVAEFDFLDPQWTTDLFMVYDEKNAFKIKASFEKLVTLQMQDLSLDQHNSVKILGSGLIFLAV